MYIMFNFLCINFQKTRFRQRLDDQEVVESMQSLNQNQSINRRKTVLPSIFEGFFLRNDTYHNYNTRWGSMYRTPLLRTFPADRTVRLRGVHISNYFLHHLTSDSLYVTYKFALKNYIINNSVNYGYCLSFLTSLDL